MKLKRNYSISFSIVTYNNKHEIRKLVDNLLKITTVNSNFQIYIIDNGSVDGTIEFCRKLSHLNEHVKLIENNNNVGFGAAHNKVISLLKSKYHVILNPDIEIQDFEELSNMIDYLDKNEMVGLLSPLILNVDGSIQKLFKRQPTVMDLAIRFISPKFMKRRQDWFVREESGYNKIEKIDYASGCFMFFRTSVLKQINGFDERYFMYMEDADITRKTNEVSTAMFFPHSKITHAWQRASHKKLKFMIISVKSMIKYFSKWGWKFF